MHGIRQALAENLRLEQVQAEFASRIGLPQPVVQFGKGNLPQSQHDCHPAMGQSMDIAC